MKAKQGARLRVLLVSAICATLTACKPSREEQVRWAQQKQIDCSDKICDGDAIPQRDHLKEEVLKLNGQWFIGPKEYFSNGMNGASFEWWDHTPLSSRMDRPPEVQALAKSGKGYAVSIEIFMTGRQRWPTPAIDKPWEQGIWQKREGELKAQGMRVERQTIKPGLDVVRFKKPDGQPYPYVYYLATARKRIRGDGPPVLSCDMSTQPNTEDSCSSGEFWQPDVYARFRLNARHAPDWPSIHEEIVRVMNLAKKVQP